MLGKNWLSSTFCVVCSPLCMLRLDHQQSVFGLRYQQVHQRRAVRPHQRPLALLHWSVRGGRHQRGLLLVVHGGRLLRPVVLQRPRPGFGMASLWADPAQGTGSRPSTGSGSRRETATMMDWGEQVKGTKSISLERSICTPIIMHAADSNIQFTDYLLKSLPYNNQ